VRQNVAILQAERGRVDRALHADSASRSPPPPLADCTSPPSPLRQFRRPQGTRRWFHAALFIASTSSMAGSAKFGRSLSEESPIAVEDNRVVVGYKARAQLRAGLSPERPALREASPERYCGCLCGCSGAAAGRALTREALRMERACSKQVARTISTPESRLITMSRGSQPSHLGATPASGGADLVRPYTPVVVTWRPLGPLGSSSSQHRRTPELVRTRLPVLQPSGCLSG